MSSDKNYILAELIDDIKSNPSFAVNLLNEKLASLIPLIDEEAQTGFLDLCLLFQENLNDLEGDNNELNAVQKRLAMNWFEQAALFLADIDNAVAAKSLIDILKHEEWPAPLSETDADILLGMLDIQVNETSAKMPEALRALFNKLQSAVATINPDDKETILAIADCSEEIGLVAGELALLGFQDVCLIMKENLSDLMNTESSLAACIGLIDQWPPLLEHYLIRPDDRIATQNILAYLSNKQWPNPVTEADLNIIADMMSSAVVEPIEPEMTDTSDLASSTVISTNVKLQEKLDDILDDVIETKDILAAPHSISTDLVKMLRTEAGKMHDEVLCCIELSKNTDTENEVIIDSLSQYALHVERFGSACQAAEMDGLYQVVSVFSNNLDYFINNETRLTAHQIGLLSAWSKNMLSYLQNPGDAICSTELVDIIKDNALPNGLMAGVAPALINLLKAVFIADADTNKETRQTVAIKEDVLIELPDDINQELLDGLLQELPGRTEAFSSAIQALIDGSGAIDEVRKAQRIAHTIKGAANTVGVKGIAVLTHHLEDIMNLLNDLDCLPSLALANVFMDAADCLEEMSEALLERGPSPANSQNVLQNILDWANRLEIEGIDCLEYEQDEDAEPISTEPKKLDQDNLKTKEEGDDATVLRVSANLIDKVLRLLGETMIVTSQLQERVRLSLLQSRQLIEHQSRFKSLASDLEVQVDVSGHHQTPEQDDVFDSLELEEYNELHTVTHHIVEAADDSYELNQEIAKDLRELDELLADKSRLHNEIQEIMLRTRMVPVKTIAPRLQRIVRQTCRATSKKVTLEITGSDTLMDSDILNKLLDPLMHLIRNAIDHGIEDEEKRIHLKKDPEGKLHLTFLKVGTQMFVKCRDDGGGLDHKSIIDTAVKRNLIAVEDELSENEINRLILYPGFSTKEQATQTSGRGVGMDIVHTQLLSMKGNVHIESVRHEGCSIELRMPLTLVSSHALLLRHSNKIIVVSNHGIEKIIHPGGFKIIKTDNDFMCEVDGERLKIQTLGHLLNIPEDKNSDISENHPALLVRDEELNQVIHIQEIVATQDLFIKSMGKYLDNIKGMLGATILGDGSVVPVVDLPELIRDLEMKPDRLEGEFTHTDDHHTRPVALVVDDSLSARRALSQVIQDAGFDVKTARDGFEAVEIIENRKPDILLVDMEMPRMNGMELTSHIRGLEDTKDLPVIMITSRSTDKHKKQAETAGIDIYMTKPFSEDDLLDHVNSLLN